MINTPTRIVVDHHQRYAQRILHSIYDSLDLFEQRQRWYTPQLVLHWIENPDFHPGETLNRLVLFQRFLPIDSTSDRASAVLQSAIDLSSDPCLRGRDVLREVHRKDDWAVARMLVGAVVAAAFAAVAAWV